MVTFSHGLHAVCLQSLVWKNKNRPVPTTMFNLDGGCSLAKCILWQKSGLPVSWAPRYRYRERLPLLCLPHKKEEEGLWFPSLSSLSLSSLQSGSLFGTGVTIKNSVVTFNDTDVDSHRSQRVDAIRSVFLLLHSWASKTT